MDEFVLGLNQYVRNFIKEKANIVIALLLVLILLNVVSIFLQTKEIRTSKTNTKEIKNKIDHRYFNTTKSLNQIHNVEIDTLNGRLINKF